VGVGDVTSGQFGDYRPQAIVRPSESEPWSIRELYSRLVDQLSVAGALAVPGSIPLSSHLLHSRVDNSAELRKDSDTMEGKSFCRLQD